MRTFFCRGLLRYQMNVKDTYLVWPAKDIEGGKVFLTNTYLKDKDGKFLEEAPGRPTKYATFIDEADWAEFVKQRDEAFQKKSATNSERASKPAYPYKKGRLGYARLEDKIVSK